MANWIRDTTPPERRRLVVSYKTGDPTVAALEQFILRLPHGQQNKYLLEALKRGASELLQQSVPAVPAQHPLPIPPISPPSSTTPSTTASVPAQASASAPAPPTVITDPAQKALPRPIGQVPGSATFETRQRLSRTANTLLNLDDES